MRLKTSQFCNLSTSASFHAWLYNNYPIVFNDLISHLRLSKGCASNASKMLDILSQLESIENAMQNLITFLSKEFPYVIAQDAIAVPITQNVITENAVFEWYDPDIISYPHKAIITGTNVEVMIKELIASKPVKDWIIVNNIGYVEYLNNEDMNLKIQDSNWEIKKYKTLANASTVVISQCSVVIPCHNYGKWLSECIESILNQTVKALEIIVIDDASTDNTPEIVKSYENRGVRYLRVNHKSPHQTRTVGFWATNGDFICFIDADDHIAPDYIEKSLKALENPESDIAFTKVQEFGDRTNLWKPVKGDINKHNFCHSGCVARRSILKQSNAFVTLNEFAAEDWEIWRRVNRADGRFNEADTTYYYRIHSGSRSGIRDITKPSLLHGIDVNTFNAYMVSVYLTSQSDPQRFCSSPSDKKDRAHLFLDTNNFYKNDDKELVKPWLDSAYEVGLKPLIITDHELPKISKKWPKTKIIKVDSCPKEFNLLTWKWCVIDQVLSQLNDLEAVFITDLFDIVFKINPFLMLTHEHDLWIAREAQMINTNTIAGQWVCDRIIAMFGTLDERMFGKPILNAGIVGGWMKPIRELASSMKELLTKSNNTEKHSDMGALNLICYTKYNHNKFWAKGEPLHSLFKGYEDHRNDVCVIHK
jgi:glycosyltransferase involved in cell wall biosynthesis